MPALFKPEEQVSRLGDVKISGKLVYAWVAKIGFDDTKAMERELRVCKR